MKKIWAIIICLVYLIAGCKSGGGGSNADEGIPGAGEEDYTASSYASEFGMWEAFEIPFADADKAGQGDSNMCWAAAAANALAWAGWAADEDDVFNIFRAYFENNPGYVYDALRFYFNEYLPGVSAEAVTVRETQTHLLLDFIVSSLHDGKGAVIKISYPNKKIGHFLTVYGYQYFLQEDNFGLYFTDSDDYLHRMRYLKLEWNDDANRWDSQGLYSGWYLEYVISLSRN
jgi:hypothetical protein